MRSPRAPILRGSGPSGSHQQPGWPSRLPAGDAVGGAGRDEGRLEGAHERPDHQAALAERDDRVGDELARAVVGHLAAALDADDLDAARGEVGRVGPDMRGVRRPTEGQDRGVLEEEQPVADPTVRTLGHESLLEGERLAVLDPPQPRRDDRPRLGGRPAPLGGQRFDRHVRTIAGPAHRAVAGHGRPVASGGRVAARDRGGAGQDGARLGASPRDVSSATARLAGDASYGSNVKPPSSRRRTRWNSRV